jgi:hypothetical protein
MIKEINKMNCPLTVYIVSGVDEDDGFKSRGILDVMVCYCLDLPCCSLSNIYSTSVREMFVIDSIQLFLIIRSMLMG